MKAPDFPPKAIRLEAIGGQGAHSAGKILAQAAVLGMGFAGNHFSSFGSEKRGSAVRSSVRYRNDGSPVRSVSPILRPDVLAVFHETLLDLAPACTEGSHSGTALVLNTSRAPGEAKFPIGFRAQTVTTIDALGISRSLGCGINAVMLGAVSALCREIDAEALKGAFSDYFSHLGSEVLARNLGGLEAGRGRARIAVFADWQAALPAPTAPLPVLGYENAPVGGVISNPGNTALRSLAHSRRGTIPVLDFERCIQCGRCDMVCPDYCFVWKIGPADRTQVTLPGGNFTRVHAFASVPILQGIDYQYCKGCQKCVAACPSGALRVAEDTPDHRARSEAARFSGRPAASGPAPLPLLLPTDKDPENES